MADDSMPTLDGVAACVMDCEPLIGDSLGLSRREVAAFAFGLASKKRADEHVANGVPVPWVSARMLVSAGEFVDRATTEGEGQE